jgi:hypothetical protein
MHLCSLKRVVCRCSSCTGTPLGYRVLTKEQLKAHELFPSSPTESKSQDELVEIKFTIAALAKLEIFRLQNFRINALVFKTNLPDQTLSSTLAELLIEDAPTNSVCLEYERWHNSTLCQLDAFSSSTVYNGCIDNCRLQLSSFHSKLFAQVTASLWRGRKSTVTATMSYDSVTPTLIEHRVKRGVGRYHFPSSFDFICNCSMLHVTGLQHTCPHMGLDPQNEHNCPTIKQLEWIEAILAELCTNSELPSGRRLELINGIKEHRNNIISYIDTQRIRRAHRNIIIHTVTTSKNYPMSVRFHID